MRGLIPALLALALLAGPVRAQEPELDRVENLIDAGDYGGARTTLEQWWAAANGREVPAPTRVRALMLRARLAPDPLSAEKDYLAIALGHPTAPEAPRALLSLGQGLLAAGDLARAANYLQRLVDDYPGSPQRRIALLWLARARRLDGAADAACSTARQGIEAAAGEAELLGLLRREEAAACPHPPDTAPQPDTGAAPQADTGAAPQTDTATAPAGRFSVQSGAFRQLRGAEALADRLRKAGYEPRLVYVPGSRLLRVRVGRFGDAAAARALARRVRAAGFAAVVVGDADDERPRH